MGESELFDNLVEVRKLAISSQNFYVDGNKGAKPLALIAEKETKLEQRIISKLERTNNVVEYKIYSGEIKQSFQ